MDNGSARTTAWWLIFRQLILKHLDEAADLIRGLTFKHLERNFVIFKSAYLALLCSLNICHEHDLNLSGTISGFLLGNMLVLFCATT